ncbi:ATP-binding protein [Allostreptomyces psammosilenae]|uniref:Anti-sigma regulatory factor (Ser/Thr protein kinase) n=1 Tax=Allostreptomyces psammosilenae TaxID=1892865 RepID=A0A853A310_9ACTN|nr:ATP-binding protein [Allostreptomyces psammosilenae]NYI04858.1 anti-sigma regulatory factor (Ser/Thr protein kinase) [Allostreptomyces psammosilenae]
MTSLFTPVQSAPTGHPAYSQTSPCEPATAAIGRKLVRDALDVWHLEPLADIAALIMTELIANAVRHTSCHSIRLIVGRPCATQVRVGVVDRAPLRLPILGRAGEEDESGRGLLLIHRLADRWGYDLHGPDRRPWGKEVWAELHARSDERALRPQ